MIKKHRDLFATIVFGASSPFLWASLVGLLSVYVQLPLFTTLAHKCGESAESWVPVYMFAWEVLESAISALIIAFPLGFLLRGRVLSMALLYSLLFLGGLWISDFISDGPSLILFILAFSGPWLFLAWSVAFIFVGNSLRKSKRAEF